MTATVATWDWKKDRACEGGQQQAVRDRRERRRPALGDADDERAALAPDSCDLDRGLVRRRRRKADQGVPFPDVDEVVGEAAAVPTDQPERGRRHAADGVEVPRELVRRVRGSDVDPVARTDFVGDRGEMTAEPTFSKTAPRLASAACRKSSHRS